MRFDRVSGSTYTPGVGWWRGVPGGLVLALTLSPLTGVAQDRPPSEPAAEGAPAGEAEAQAGGASAGVEDGPTEGADRTSDTQVAPKRADALRREQWQALRLGKIDPSRVPIREKQRRVDAMLAEQRVALRHGTELLQEARNTKDIVQLNCVNEKLTQIKGLLKLTENAATSMYDALGADDGPTINHEFTKMFVASQRSRGLRDEAEQCVGERSVYTGRTEVEVEIDSDISPKDPTLPLPPPPGPETPSVASAF